MMKNYWINCAGLLLALTASLHAGETLYEETFESVAEGDSPADILVFDGDFEVKEFKGGKVFELPGAPLETFGFLFGPNIIFNADNTRFQIGEKEIPGFIVSARGQSLKTGRRYPTYSIGVCGVSGYKLRVAPMKRAVELVKGEETVASRDLDWPSGEWTELKLKIEAKDGKWAVAGKVWKQGEPEPDWQLTHVSTDRPNPGKASAWAAPFSNKPIAFDDLKVETVEEQDKR